MKELLFSVTKKDLKITYFSGKGAGGQHRNKHMNCVRIQHPDSGVMVTGQEERSREMNLKSAFKRLTEHEMFKNWLKIKASEMSMDKDAIEKEINDKVDREMKNIKVETFDGQIWTEDTNSKEV